MNMARMRGPADAAGGRSGEVSPELARSLASGGRPPSLRDGTISSATMSGAAAIIQTPRPPATQSTVNTKLPRAWPSSGPKAMGASHPVPGTIARTINTPGNRKISCERIPKVSAAGPAIATKVAR
jgi:hypothetical protein